MSQAILRVAVENQSILFAVAGAMSALVLFVLFAIAVTRP